MQPARPLGRACCIPPQVFNALPGRYLDIFLSPTPPLLSGRMNYNNAI